MKKIIFSILLFHNTFNNAQNIENIKADAHQYIREMHYDKAFPLLLKAAELGDPQSQYLVGHYYDKGYGATKNMIEAIKWYNKAIENNFLPASYALASIYNHGWDVPENKPLAFKIMNDCTAKNDISCMWYVADAYLTGNGVTKNESEAERLFIKIATSPIGVDRDADSYIKKAPLLLAELYSSGKFLDKKNYYASYIWYLIYNENKKYSSEYSQKYIIEEIQRVQKQLTPIEIENSKQKAENFLGRKLEQIHNLYQIVTEVR